MMVANDFPAWYSAGVFGGIGCALLSALSIASWSLWRQRGVTPRVIGALLVCLVSIALDIIPFVWTEYRLNVYGPTLAMGEVLAALTLTALVGWAAPLAAMCWYMLLATPLSSQSAPLARVGVPTPASLDDPARTRAVQSDGLPWATLAPIFTAESAPTTRPIALMHALTLIGREPDNDIVLDDDRISRRHAELRWERGRIELFDYGSLNGTRVNHQAARGRLPLRDGDLIELGKQLFQLKVVEDCGREAQQARHESDAMEETRKNARVSSRTGVDSRPLAKLTLVRGTAAAGAEAWPLSAPLTTIGRDPTCGVPLTDTSISRVHAQIARQPSGYFLTDLQSSNGVLLNGHAIEGPAQIFAGDVIALGDCLLRFEEATTQPDAKTAKEAASHMPTDTPQGVPSFHMRIAPEWNTRRDSRPRLAPTRLTLDGREPRPR